MENITGLLRVEKGESRINGRLLARVGTDNPFGNATSFLSDNDCTRGDCVTVTGTQRTNAFYIDTAVRESDSKCAAAESARISEGEEMAGILSVTDDESRINGKLLARGTGDPFGNATAFLSDNDCRDGDCVTVTGTQRDIGFFIDTAVRENDSKCAPVGEIEGEPAVAELAVAATTTARSQKPTKKKSQKKKTKPTARKKGRKVVKASSRGAAKKATSRSRATKKLGTRKTGSKKGRRGRGR
jgi:hypothetical protein